MKLLAARSIVEAWRDDDNAVKAPQRPGQPDARRVLRTDG
jgi:hypothetical protein